MKACGDKRCPRLGQKLPPREFPRNRQRPDGRNLYCRKCSLRRVHEYRAKVRELKKLRQEQKELKTVVVVAVGRKLTVAETVQNEIAKGPRTREEIQVATNLRYDLLGDALAQLWEKKTIRIQRVGERREFIAA